MCNGLVLANGATMSKAAEELTADVSLNTSARPTQTTVGFNDDRRAPVSIFAIGFNSHCREARLANPRSAVRASAEIPSSRYRPWPRRNRAVRNRMVVPELATKISAEWAGIRLILLVPTVTCTTGHSALDTEAELAQALYHDLCIFTREEHRVAYNLVSHSEEPPAPAPDS